jgi:hypothetical protein
VPWPASLGGLGGGPFGACTCGDELEGCVIGVVLSFCPGNGRSPANASTTMIRIAMGIQILI